MFRVPGLGVSRAGLSVPGWCFKHAGLLGWWCRFSSGFLRTSSRVSIVLHASMGLLEVINPATPHSENKRPLYRRRPESLPRSPKPLHYG